MRTPNLFLLPFLLLGIACGDDAGSSPADASADGSSSQPDASLTDPDGSTGVPDASTALPDASTALPDAAMGTDAGSTNLSQLVDDIADRLNNIGATLCACDANFCGIFQISASQRACMQGVISGQPATAQLQSDLQCAADGVAVAETCVGNQSCDQAGMFACFDNAPACLESPLFAQGFEACLDDSP